jgi:5-methyltetrahydrofolate--homocysteine methyltransferase
MPILEDIQQSVIDGEIGVTGTLVQQALGEGLAPRDILSQGLTPAMAEVGELFERQEYFIPEMMISARAMQAGLNVLRPLLANSGVKPVGRVVLGTVTGDLHDIGKNMVGMLMEGAGFEVEDLGVNVPAGQFVEAAKSSPEIIGMSALLTTTMGEMKTVIEALSEAGLRDNVKVIVGGAPVTPDFAEEIGADGFAADAGSAAKLASNLVAANTPS